MKKTIVTAALGFGVLVGSLMSGSPVGAAPVSGLSTAGSYSIACDCSILYTTSSLNFRSGPGTSYDVIAVMPAGTKVQKTNVVAPQNGFAKVYYDGNIGWASLDYLTEDAGGSDSGSSGYDPSAYDQSMITDAGVVTSFSVNFRTGPGTGYDIQAVLDEGDQVAWTNVVIDDFRLVWHAGDMGWIHIDWVIVDDGRYDDGTGVAGGGTAAPGSTATVTSALNLRAQPSTSSTVLLVMPEGAEVTLHDDGENGFVTVTYNGVTGWAYSAYLT